MSTPDFNYHIRRASYNNESMKLIYEYCEEIIKIHVHYRYGNNNYYDDVPHDIITRITIEYPPKNYIKSPPAYICIATQNYLNNLTRLSDNQTLELFENYPYEPDFESNFEFLDENIIPSWNKLDYLSRYILYLDTLLNYKLNEIAEMLSLRPDYVRTKKSRAIKFLRLSLNQKGEALI